MFGSVGSTVVGVFSAVLGSYPGKLVLLVIFGIVVWELVGDRFRFGRGVSSAPVADVAPAGVVAGSDFDPRLFSYEQRMEVGERDGFRCAYCGGSGLLEMDHVVPFSHGGPTEVWNAQLLCGKGVGCESNAYKGAVREDVARFEFFERTGQQPVTGMGIPAAVAWLFVRAYGEEPIYGVAAAG